MFQHVSYCSLRKITYEHVVAGSWIISDPERKKHNLFNKYFPIKLINVSCSEHISLQFNNLLPHSWYSCCSAICPTCLCSLPTVNLHMSYKIAFTWESLFTLVLLIWSLARVNTHMPYKSGIVRVSFVTLTALIWSFSVMNLHMFL